MLYHPQSETARPVEEFAHDFGKRTGRKFELLSLESRDGSAMASLYDIVRYPAILALAGDGSLLKSWQGNALPLMDEVSYYAQQA